MGDPGLACSGPGADVGQVADLKAALHRPPGRQDLSLFSQAGVAAMGSTGPEEPKAPLLKSTAPPGPASPLMPKGPARGDASALMSVVSIVKNIVGAGVLSLPAGLAAAGTVRAGVLAAVLLGLLAGYMFAVIGRVCGAVHAGSFGAVAARTNSKGFATVCEVVCIFKTAAGCLAYSILIRDSAGALLAGYLDVPQTPALGRTLLMGLTAAVLLPLCLLRSLASLQYTSILGLLGMIYTTLFMAYRLYDGSYAADGHYHAYMQEHLQPHFPPEPEERPMLALVLVSLLSTAYMAHYNVPRFYWSLKDTSPGRFQGVVACAFVMTIALFVAFMVIGFLTFGENCQGFVLNNYSTQVHTAVCSVVGGRAVVYRCVLLCAAVLYR